MTIDGHHAESCQGSDEDSLPLEDPDDDYDSYGDEEYLEELLVLKPRRDPPLSHDRVRDIALSYIRSPLSHSRQIRLMNIQHWWRLDDPIEIGMEVVSVDDSTKYLTLSYVWGPRYPDGSHLTQSIMCRHMTADGSFRAPNPLRITGHLYQALQRVREYWARIPEHYGERTTGATLRLWVDAICINQEDAAERSEQVRLMGQIYANSSCTLIWLGENALHGGSMISRELEGSGTHDAARVKELRAIARRLRKHAYFQRRWVLQEYALSKTCRILAGQRSFWAHGLQILWTGARAPTIYPTSGQMSVHDNSSILGISKLNFLHGSLLGNLLKYRHTKCADPRDIVYALLALSLDADQVKIDYEQNMEDLCRAVAEIYVRQSINDVPNVIHSTAIIGILFLCYAAGTTCNRPRQLEHVHKTIPSWMPRWDQPHSAIHYLISDIKCWTEEHSGKYSSSSCRWVDDKTMALSGLLCDVRGCLVDNPEVHVWEHEVSPFKGTQLSGTNRDDLIIFVYAASLNFVISRVENDQFRLVEGLLDLWAGHSPRDDLEDLLDHYAQDIFVV